jgi:hypothetical protein
MTPLKKTARIAGLWYLMFALGPFYLLYVPSKTVVHNDAAATSALIISHEKLFRFGLLAETLGAVVFIGLALALYRLFEGVDRHRARQMVALVLVSAALVLVGVVFNSAAVIVFRGGDAWTAFDQQTREAIGMLLIRLHGQSNGVNEMFWELWLFLKPLDGGKLSGSTGGTRCGPCADGVRGSAQAGEGKGCVVAAIATAVGFHGQQIAYSASVESRVSSLPQSGSFRAATNPRICQTLG